MSSASKNTKNFYQLSRLVIFAFIFLASFQAVLAQVAAPELKVDLGDKITFDKGCTYVGEGDERKCQINWIGEYIAAVYRYGIGLAAVLAVVMIMAAGFVWVASAGNSARVKTAQEMIMNSLAGLSLALISFVILQTINPRLVSLDPLEIKSIKNVELKYAATGFCCQTATGKVVGLDDKGGCSYDMPLDKSIQCGPEQKCDCVSEWKTGADRGLCRQYACSNINEAKNNVIDSKVLAEAQECLLKKPLIKTLPNFRITSVGDGTHNTKSCHYLGLAIDVAWDSMSSSQASTFCGSGGAGGCFNVCLDEIAPRPAPWTGAHFHLAVCGCSSKTGYDKECAGESYN